MFIPTIGKNFLISKTYSVKGFYNQNKKEYQQFTMNILPKNYTKLPLLFQYFTNPNAKLFNFGLIVTILFYSVSVLAIPEINPGISVLDESNNLTKSSVNYIQKSLEKVKEIKQIEVIFVSVRSIPYGQNPQEFAQELFQKWNLNENNVIVVLVNKLAKAGIYYGSQVTVLSDEIVKSICEETYTNKAKEEQYSSAALDVSNRLVSLLLEKGDIASASSFKLSSNSSNFKSAKKTEESRSKYIAIIAILLIIAFVVPMIQFFYYVKDE
jgi:uncharacterized protein